jgi:hypothetical protein
MRLYKFKNLSNREWHSHFLQIVLDKCIWCACPDSLNDPEEFRFGLDYRPTPRTLPLLIDAIANFGTANLLLPNLSASHAITNDRLELLAAPVIAVMIENCRKTIGVTSFSMDGEDPQIHRRAPPNTGSRPDFARIAAQSTTKSVRHPVDGIFSRASCLFRHAPRRTHLQGSDQCES